MVLGNYCVLVVADELSVWQLLPSACIRGTRGCLAADFSLAVAVLRQLTTGLVVRANVALT